jgi:hypothetical protein
MKNKDIRPYNENGERREKNIFYKLFFFIKNFRIFVIK